MNRQGMFPKGSLWNAFRSKPVFVPSHSPDGFSNFIDKQFIDWCDETRGGGQRDQAGIDPTRRRKDSGSTHSNI